MSDEIKALVEREKKLIALIISMYHTTRLSETPFADHIHSKAIVREAFANYREAALTAQAEEIERLRRLTHPQWFYYGDDCGSDRCRDSIYECIDEDFLWDNKAEGSHVLEISTATNLPTIWALVHFFTDEEKIARDSDDDYEVIEFASEAEARAALKAAQEVKNGQ